MTGMDRETMQKSISVKTLPDSQKNMVVLGFVLLGVVSLFLYLGALLHLFAANAGVQAQGDSLFPAVAAGGGGRAAAVLGDRPEPARAVRPLAARAGVAGAQRRAHLRWAVAGVTPGPGGRQRQSGYALMCQA